MNSLMEETEAKYMKEDMPDFRPGDTIRVNVRIHEQSSKDDRQRIQAFEGVVVKRTGSRLAESVTVRRVTYGVGVERTFPLHAPVVDSIEVLRRGHVRRARLYYLRGRSGRASRIKESKQKPGAELKDIKRAQEAKADAAGQAEAKQTADEKESAQAEEQPDKSAKDE